MRIHSVRSLGLSRMHELDRQWFTSDLRIVKADACIVIVEAEGGRTGLGEATPYGEADEIARVIECFEASVIGRSISDDLPFNLRFPGPPIGRFPHIRPAEAARAGLDIAIWDLRAQVAQRPLNKFLNAGAADEVDCYASTGVKYDWRSPEPELIREVQEAVALGYQTVKVRLGTQWAPDDITVDRFLGLLSEVQGEIPTDISLAVDGNSRLDFHQALEMAKGLARLGCAWFEEPIPLELSQYSELRRRSDIPITGGESLATFKEFEGLMRGGAFDVVQPDVSVTGITDALKVAELADELKINVCTHNWHNDLMTLGNAHFMSAIGSAWPLERCLHQGPLQSALLVNPVRVQQGKLKLPATAGLGAELRADLSREFPHIEGHYAVEVSR